MAGLSAAWHLGRLGTVRVLEREPWVFGHSSGRNAAMFIHLSGGSVDAQLARRSRLLLDAVAPRWRLSEGALLTASVPATRERALRLSRAEGVRAEPLAAAGVRERVPALEGGSETCGLWCPDDAVIDVHAVGQALRAAATERGAQLDVSTEVTGVRVERGRATGVTLAGGGRAQAGAVVLAGGAWSAALGRSAGAALPLHPLRRHLVWLDARGLPPDAPIAWSLDGQVYFRPESGGVLASPCDETPAEPGDVAADPAALEALAERLARVAPSLGSGGVRRIWACLRTFALADRAPVVGADPRLAGLWWLAGLGGHGMTGGLAAAEVLARAVSGAEDALAQKLAPERLLSGTASSAGT